MEQDIRISLLENPPPPCGTGWFSLLPYTHTHHVSVNVWPFYLPTPPPVEQDGFPFCSETHTHTHTTHVSVYLSVHALLLSLRSILWCGAKRRTIRGAARLSWGSSRLQALVFGGGYHWGGGRGGGRTAHNHIYIYVKLCTRARGCVCVCARCGHFLHEPRTRTSRH